MYIYIYIYILSSIFELIMDHKSLEVIYSIKSKPFIKYKPSKDNIADALSRLTPMKEISSRNIGNEYVKFIALQAALSAISIKEIERENDKVVTLMQIRDAILAED